MNVEELIAKLQERGSRAEGSLIEVGPELLGLAKAVEGWARWPQLDNAANRKVYEALDILTARLVKMG